MCAATGLCLSSPSCLPPFMLDSASRARCGPRDQAGKVRSCLCRVHSPDTEGSSTAGKGCRAEHSVGVSSSTHTAG